MWLGLLVVFFHVSVQVSAWDYPYLPANLDQLAPHGKEDLGISEYFLIDPARQFYYWTITPEKPLFLRIDFEVYNSELELRLQEDYDKTMDEVMTRSRGQVSKRLEKNKTYSLQFEFQGEIKSEVNEASTEVDCGLPHIILNLYTRAEKEISNSININDYTNPFEDDQFLHNIDDFISSHNTFTYMSINHMLDLDQVDDNTWLASYDINAQDAPSTKLEQGHTGLWHVTITAHLDFLTGGGFNMLMETENMAQDSATCLEREGCIAGKFYAKNTLILSTFFNPGQYKLRFYVDDEELVFLAAKVKFIPFTLSMKFEPLVQTPDRFNCKAVRIPGSLNRPGLMSSGMIHYKSEVLLDLYAGTQYSSFTITEDSIVRVVTIEPSGVDVGLSLLDEEDKIITSSNVVGGSEGIVAEIAPGRYKIKFVFFNTIIEDSPLRFCETFYVEIGITTSSHAKGLKTFYDLNACPDDSEELNTIFDGIWDAMSGEAEEFLIEPSRSSMFHLPIPDLNKSEQVMWKKEIIVYDITYASFEIMTDFILNDVNLQLSKTGKELFGSSTKSEQIGPSGRKTVHGLLHEGTYTLSIVSAPMNKQPDGSDKAGGQSFNVIPSCAAFQLEVQMIAIAEKNYKEWECADEDFTSLPSTLNTIGVLGTTGQDQNIAPPAQFYSKAVLAPDSRKEGNYDEMEIYAETASIFRATVIAQAGVRIELAKGDKVFAYDMSKKKRNPPIYTLSYKIKQHQTYYFRVYYFPKDDLICNLYEINIELKSQHAMSSLACSNDFLPTSTNFLSRHSLSDSREIIDMSGYTIHDEIYNYSREDRNWIYEIPFSVKEGRSLLRGELETSFVESGLHMLITQDDEKIAHGSYDSSNVYTLNTVLDEGEYNLVLKETGFNVTAFTACIDFAGSLWLEDADTWSEYSDLLQRAETCGHIYMPDELNIEGQMSQGELHWNQEVPMDTVLKRNDFSFEVKEESVIHLYIEPNRGIKFHVNFEQITVGQGPTDLNYKSGEQATTLYKAMDGYHDLLSPGFYVFSITYDGKIPHSRECPLIDMDLHILPKSIYDERKPSCENASSFPKAISTAGTFLMTASQTEVLKKQIEIKVNMAAKIAIELSFDNSISGIITMALYKEKVVVLRSSNVQNFAAIHGELEEGDYILQIRGTQAVNETRLPPACHHLSLAVEWLSMYAATTDEECSHPILLPQLYDDEDLEGFGGPQDKDGTINFYGEFLAQVEKSHSVLFNIAEKSIVRVMHISNDDQVIIESSLYDSLTSEKPVAYSRHKDTQGSFIIQLDPKTNPYVLTLSFASSEATVRCPTYQLKIEILDDGQTRNRLTCGQPGELPPTDLELAGTEELNSAEYFISADWVIGDAKDLPPGVQSDSKENSPFIFVMNLIVPNKIDFSAEVGFDFLTNDITLILKQKKEVLIQGDWAVLNEDSIGEIYNISNGFQDFLLEPGTYQLVIKQSIAQNHLLQIFTKDRENLCFPFLLGLRFIPYEQEEGLRITQIKPESRKNLNPGHDIEMIVQFSLPLELANKDSLSGLLELVPKEGRSIKPDKYSISTSHKDVIKANFPSWDLEAATCYDLNINVDVVELRSGKIEPETLVHRYCTTDCHCNPYSMAVCDDSMQCACLEPYTGVSCGECIEGYNNRNGYCHINECDECFSGVCASGRCSCILGVMGPKCDQCEDPDSKYPNCAASDNCTPTPFPKNLKEDSVLYGGPQDPDGGIFFSGVFTFSTYSKPQALKFKITEPCIMRLMSSQIDHNMNLIIKLYRAEISDEPMAYTTTDELDKSFITYLKKQSREYYMTIEPEDITKCTQAQIIFEIKRTYLIDEEVMCPNEKGSLPPQEWVAHKSRGSWSNRSYSVTDKQLEGEDGIVAEEYEMPYYSISINVGQAMTLSSYLTYDFITTDMFLEIRDSNAEILSESGWEKADDDEQFNFISLVDPIDLTPGNYELRIVFNDSIKELFEVMPNTDYTQCIKFGMEIEVNIHEQASELINEVVQVEPVDKLNLDISHHLTIYVSFAEPIILDTMHSGTIKLLDDYNVSVNPGKTSSAKKGNSKKIKVQFDPYTLKADTCYTLDVKWDEIKNVDSSIKSVGWGSDDIHTFCTSSCECNPKSLATCIRNQCVCPHPYEGPNCSDCSDTFDRVKIPGGSMYEVICKHQECDCGDHGVCEKGACKCDNDFTGENCEKCEDSERAFPDCEEPEECDVHFFPKNISYDSKNKKSSNKLGSMSLDKNGEIHLHSDKVAGNMQTIEMTIYHFCVLRVETSLDADVTFFENGQTEINPTTVLQTEDDKMIYVWLVRKNNLTYFLNLESEGGQKCEDYVADIQIENLNDLSSIYECSRAQRLPLSILSTVKKQYKTHIPLNYFKTTDLPYNIDFELKTKSQIASAIEFNSLFNFLTLKLIPNNRKLEEDYESTLSEDQASSLPSASSLEATLNPGQYTLQISDLYDGQSFANEMKAIDLHECAPFSFTLDIAAIDDDIPVLVGIQPAGDFLAVKEDEDYKMQFLFSAQPYNSRGKMATSADMKQAYVIKYKGKKGKAKIFPQKAQQKDAEGMKWTFVFDSNMLMNNRDYEIVQVPRVIFSSTNVEFGTPLIPMPTLTLGIKTAIEQEEMHKKVEDTVIDSKKEASATFSCSKHGTITLDARGKMICECNEGYEGEDCKYCSPSYIKTSEGNCVYSRDTSADEAPSDYENSSSDFETTPSNLISEGAVPNSSASYSQVWIFIFVGIAGVSVIVIIRRYIKDAGSLGRRGRQQEMQMRSYNLDEEEGIDLHSNRYDNMNPRQHSS